MVTSAADSGPSTLRAAITEANPGDVIEFAIGTGPKTIDLKSALPAITKTLTIDARTETGYTSGTPIVELNGSAAGSAAVGLELDAASCNIYGLAITQFTGPGVKIDAGATGCTVESCYFGVHLGGQNAGENQSSGLEIDSNSNTIGGATSGQGNLISANGAAGILIKGAGNMIVGNEIGTNAAGTAALGNTTDGITILGSHNTIGGAGAGAGNLISGNVLNGITLGPGSATVTGNTIQGNFIGVDSTGMAALGNGGNGVDVQPNTTSSTIGGEATGAANIIADNGGIGVAIESGSPQPAGITISANSIYGNSALGISVPNGFLNYPVITKASVGLNNIVSIAGTYSSAPMAQKITLEFFDNTTGDPSGHGQGQIYLGSTVVETGPTGLASFTTAFHPNVAAPLGAITATATDAAGDTSAFALNVTATTAPQVTVNGQTASYTDIDGDHVTITTTRGTFSPDLFTTSVAGLGLQLDELNLFFASFNHASITFTVKKAPTGDGLANVGVIAGGTNDFGSITVDGDLGAIDCGSSVAGAAAIKSLNVHSMGDYGLATQVTPGSLESTINGGLGALHVTGDVDGEYLNVTGSIGPVTVGGSLIGGATANSGDILSDGSIGQVKIGGDVRGGSGFQSGAIIAAGQTKGITLAGVTIGGSLLGGDGVGSGEVLTSGGGVTPGTGDLGPVIVDGNVEGGGGIQSGLIGSNNNVGNVSIHGSLIGGVGGTSGTIYSVLNIGIVTIGQNVTGGSGGASGAISSGGTLASVSIGGSLTGGSNSYDGSIMSTGNMGQVTIGHQVQGGAGDHTGYIEADGNLTGVTIGGSLVGASNSYTGAIYCPTAGSIMGTVKIGGDIQGGGGSDSGYIDSNGTLAGANIGGSLLGGGSSGAARDSGEISSNGNIGLVKIGHDVVGGIAYTSGVIDAGGALAGVTIGGSLIGGGGGSTTVSGEITSQAKMGLIKIAHDLLGGVDGLQFCGEISSGAALAGVKIGGSLIGSSNAGSFDTGEIQSVGPMGMITVGGDIHGGAGAASGEITSDDALAGVSVGGSVIGGSASATGFIFSILNMGPVKIGRDLRGGSLPSGSNSSFAHSGFIEADGRLAGVSIGGSVIAGTNDTSGALTLTENASIVASDDIGYITVGGSVVGSVGSAGAVTKVIFSAKGPAFPTATSNVAFGKITIGGRVEQTQILAGYSGSQGVLTPVNGDAQIGSVTVGGDWIASDLIAGVQEAAGVTGFGSAGDAIIGTPTASIAKIAAIVIKGIVEGTPATSDQFAFESHSIGSLSINGAAITLPAAPGDAITLSPLSGDDVTVRLV